MSALEAKNAVNSPKKDRIGLRVPKAIKNDLVRAAAISGRSLSDFVLDSALNAARETVAAHERMVLADTDREKFLAALFNPPEPSDHLKSVARRYKETVRR